MLDMFVTDIQAEFFDKFKESQEDVIVSMINGDTHTGKVTRCDGKVMAFQEKRKLVGGETPYIYCGILLYGKHIVSIVPDKDTFRWKEVK